MRVARTLFFLVGVILALPVGGYAQEATLTGIVTDSTGGVLPGVTVTVTHDATGNRFVTTTDGSGTYRLPVRVGSYVVTAELQSFTTVTRGGVQLLVGQTATVNLQMALSTVQETVTVTGEAALLDVTSSSLSGNIDPRQVQELPVQGRNWLALAMLAPGSRMTSPSATVPLADRNTGEFREFRFEIDGQSVAAEMGYGGQPRYSQDSIAEFQYISNRFDATQGRSSGVQVKAITRSGSNAFSGSVRGNFRDTRFNATNPVLNRVVPIDNQQIASTLGGPILRDRLHFFGHFEYEREPKSSIWNTPYPAFNVTLDGKETNKMGGVRVDYQLSPQIRVMGKISEDRHFVPFNPGNNSHPAATGSQADLNGEYLGQLVHVLSNRAVNEMKGGYTKYKFDNANLTTWSQHWQKGIGVATGSPRITFSTFTIGGNSFFPRYGAQDSWSFRDDFTLSYTARGRHDLKTGFEYIRFIDDGNNCSSCMGVIDARGGTPANIEQLFPDPWNADTWNLAAISPLVRTYNIGIGNYATYDHRPQYGVWVQDDWQVSSKVVLNIGVRYDLAINSNGNQYAIPPFIPETGRPDDKNNIQPRFGMVYQLNQRTVIRGGTGLYFGVSTAGETFWMAQADRLRIIQYTNDGRANFAADPLNGRPLPTFAEAEQQFCHVNNVTGCLRLTRQELAPPKYATALQRTWQNSIGVARQIGTTMAVEADYIYSNSDHEKDIIDNVNLTFNPATGANYPFTDISRRPYPLFGLISLNVRTGRSSYHALQTAFTKRLSQRWQGSVTYTLSGLRNAEAPPHSGIDQVAFPVAPDFGGEWAFDASDQRHRAVFNGIWQVGRGFQLSSLYYLGIGERAATSYGGDVRGFGGAGSARYRPDGTIVPRNAFTQPTRQRFDLRVQQRIPLGGRVSIEGIAEVFNLFNATNFVINTVESNAQFMRATSGENRTAQLGFRLAF